MTEVKKKLVQANRSPSLVSCPEEQVFVELLRAADILSRRPARLLKAAGLSLTQYNVLRILRGAPEGRTCADISGRMITRDPDITRLLDRLERRHLISRSRNAQDRRRVVTQIAPAGLKLLAQLDTPIRELHRRQLRPLGRLSLRRLEELLRRLLQRLDK